ncbi:MAG: hypothetical protein ACE5J2_01325 [Nitrososphaerales archaeon]
MSTELPKWAEDEINSITSSSFKQMDIWEGTGYFLEIDEKKHKADVQFYEKLPIGKYIISVTLSRSINVNDLMKGFVYNYKVKVLKAALSEKLTEYLKENLKIEMDGVYQFELESLQLLDVESDLAPATAEEDSED